MFFFIHFKKSAAVIGLLLMAASLFALEVRTPGEGEPTVTETGTIASDYLFCGQRLELSGSVEDLYFFGDALHLTGTTTGHILTIARSVVIDGPVSGNLQAGGDTVTVNGPVADTCFLAGKTLVIGPDSVISGDVLAAGSELTLRGTINGNLQVGAGYVTIDGTVNGNVVVKSGELVLTERARINGNLTYDTEAALDHRSGGRVSGTVTKTVFNEKSWGGPCKTPREDRKGGAGFAFFFLAGIWLSLLGGGLLFLMIPAFRPIFSGGLTHKPFWSGVLWGLIPLFLYPVAIGLTLILFPVSITLALAWIPLMAVSAVVGIARFGEYMFGVFKWKKVNRFQFFLFGLVLLLAPMVIPGIGMLTFLFVSAAGWGVIISLLFGNGSSKGEPALAS